ncbi:MAG TPA: metallophosphoesterase family protein [Thermomicrobiaceae bacterium]|nr:metallophosphoesterase family protein [Thermomicrobiaceae bacterium]
MRVAVISDTHGNVHALRAVLAEVDARGPWDRIVMGGDIAFGGPFPGECIDLLRARGVPALRGNTDEAIVELARGPVAAWADEEGHAPHSAEPDERGQWALAHLSDEQIDYLAGLPLRIELGGGDVPRLTVVHATPWSPYPAVQPHAPEEVAARLLDAAGSQALAYGHIHVQYARPVDGRLLVAVGSVGLPFDGSPDADYAEFASGPSGWAVELRSVRYDTAPVVAAAEERGLPGVENIVARLRGGESG